MANRNSGIGRLSVSGIGATDLKGDITWALGILEGETDVSMDGTSGTNFSRVPAYCEFTSRDRSDLDITRTFSPEYCQNRTVQWTMANGKTYVLPAANQINQVEVSAEDGSFTLRFESVEQGEEITV